jgi:putative aldouronate transport system permease protein
MIIGIDRSLYEAAVVDGANKWHQIKHITLPCLKGTIIILTLMSVGRIFYSDFGLFYQIPMNSGLLVNVTNTIDTYVYRGLLQLNDAGRASAAGFYQSIVGFIVVLTANLVVRKIDKDNALF